MLSHFGPAPALRSLRLHAVRREVGVRSVWRDSPSVEATIRRYERPPPDLPGARLAGSGPPFDPLGCTRYAAQAVGFHNTRGRGGTRQLRGRMRVYPCATDLPLRAFHGRAFGS